MAMNLVQIDRPSGDDALYLLADLLNYQLDEKEKAKELYRMMLTRHPGSVFTEESREKFRELRKIYPDVLTRPEEEFFIQDLFISISEIKR